VRFLLDECLKSQLKDILRHSGHDAIHVTDLGLQGEPDEQIMAAACRDDRVLLSADTDFGELLVKSGAELPSVVLFRRGRRSPIDQATILLDNLDAISNDLISGAIVVFSDDRLRIRALPIQKNNDT